MTRTTVAEMSAVLECRETASAPDLHLVRDDTQAAPRFTGHAAVFDERTEIGNPFTWGWYEEVSAGAFDKTLAEGDARFLVDHDSSLLVARVSAGDLRLATDDIGLSVDADLDVELSYVSDLVRNLDARRITGMSFGFYVVRDDWTTEDMDLPNGKTASVDVRTIQEVRLVEVSAVTFPAYPQTDAGLRSVREARGITHNLPPHDGDGSAPPDEGTRSDDVAPPDEGTRRVMRELLALELKAKAEI